MPIPGSNVDDDAARFHGAMQHSRNTRENESKNASSEMKAVHRCKNVNKGTAGAAGEVEASRRKLAPNEELAGKKRDTKQGGHAEPGEAPFVPQRYAGN